MAPPSRYFQGHVKIQTSSGQISVPIRRRNRYTEETSPRLHLNEEKRKTNRTKTTKRNTLGSYERNSPREHRLLHEERNSNIVTPLFQLVAAQWAAERMANRGDATPRRGTFEEENSLVLGGGRKYGEELANQIHLRQQPRYNTSTQWEGIGCFLHHPTSSPTEELPKDDNI